MEEKKTGTGKFDYVAYDAVAQQLSNDFKECFIALDATVEAALKPGRARALAVTKLEEAFTWIGKAIRDEQIARNGEAALQP